VRIARSPLLAQSSRPLPARAVTARLYGRCLPPAHTLTPAHRPVVPLAAAFGVLPDAAAAAVWAGCAFEIQTKIKRKCGMRMKEIEIRYE